MPTAKTHRRLGATFGVGIAILVSVLTQKGMISGALFRGGQLDIFFFLMAGACGLLGGLLPDIIEPSFHGPRHRGFFHSILLLFGLGILAFLFLYGGVLASPEQFYWRIGVFFVLIGYISHLLVDLLTDQGLPLIF